MAYGLIVDFPAALGPSAGGPDAGLQSFQPYSQLGDHIFRHEVL